MITQVGNITLYVNSQDRAAQFWVKKIGFQIAIDQTVGQVRWLEVTPLGDNLTTIVLYDKASMAQVRPEAVAHPTIIFEALEIESVWNQLRAKGVEVSEL